MLIRVIVADVAGKRWVDQLTGTAESGATRTGPRIIGPERPVSLVLELTVTRPDPRFLSTARNDACSTREERVSINARLCYNQL